MEIHNRFKYDKVQFASIPIGECFIHEDVEYLRVKYHDSFLGVSLKDGFVHPHAPNTLVKRVKGSVTLSNYSPDEKT